MNAKHQTESAQPKVIVIAGPNGAGKSTAAPIVLRGVFHVQEFVNADVIARGLSAFHPESVAISAGRIMLGRLKELADAKRSFAFETTLATRSFAPWISDLTSKGYAFQLVYLWLADPEIAIARVAARVKMGGHDVPEETIRRRYFAGIANFFELYKSRAMAWRWYDNSSPAARRLIASGGSDRKERIYVREAWQKIEKFAESHLSKRSP